MPPQPERNCHAGQHPSGQDQCCGQRLASLCEEWTRRNSCRTTINAVEVIRFDQPAGRGLDPLHDLRPREPLTVDVSVDGLDADLDLGCESWDRDVLV